MAMPKKFYIVRLRADDRLICCGSKEECAATMKMTVNTFMTTVSRCRNGLNKKYEIDVMPEDEDE